MDAREQHIGAPAKSLRGAVAVVNVPVEDEDAPRAQLADRQLGGDRDVVEEAEAHRALGLGVMPGRADGAEGDRGLAGQQGAHHRAGSAGRVLGRAEGLRDHRRVRVERPPAAGAQLGDRLHVCGRVHELQLLLAGRRRLAKVPPGPLAPPQLALERAQAPGRLGMAGREQRGIGPWSSIGVRAHCLVAQKGVRGVSV